MPEELNNQTDIFLELGMENTSDKDKEVIIQSLQELLQERIMLKLNEILNEEQKASLSKFAEENKDSELAVLNFIMNMVPEYEEISKKEALKLREELVSEYNVLKK